MIKVSEPNIGQEEIDEVTKVLQSGRLADGTKTKEFEQEFERYQGSHNAVACCNGTAGLHMALIAAGVKKGDEVLVPPLTFFATIEAVLYVGAKPVFVDIDRENFCMNPFDVMDKITKKTKAMIPVHIFGQPCNMRLLSNISHEKGITMIEDCAQAHGALVNFRRVGTFGDFGVFSFYATKNMTTGGEGGMVMCKYKHQAEEVSELRNHGMTDRDTHLTLGYNYRMTEIQAAIGTVQLAKLERLNANRKYVSIDLKNKIRGRIPWLKAQEKIDDTEPVYFWSAFRVDEDILGMDTGKLVNELKSKGLEVRQRYSKPLYHQPVIQKSVDNWSPIDFACPNSEDICGKIIGLPNHHKITLETVDKIISILESV